MQVPFCDASMINVFCRQGKQQEKESSIPFGLTSAEETYPYGP